MNYVKSQGQTKVSGVILEELALFADLMKTFKLETQFSLCAHGFSSILSEHYRMHLAKFTYKQHAPCVILDELALFVDLQIA